MLFSCCATAESKQNAQIARAQRKAEQNRSKQVSILILGTGDSGKTTLRKQLMNVHSDQFNKPEFRATFAGIILGNLLDGVLEVLAHMQQGSSKAQEISIVKEAAREITSELTPELHAMLTGIIDDAFLALAKQSSHTSNIQLQDCFLVFAQELLDVPNWGLPGWVPTAEDCVRSRVRTSGIVSEPFSANGVPFIVHDVGGQRVERRKWAMGAFTEAITAAIFVSSISEYDQVLFEDRTKNRLEEAFDLFRDCVNSSWLSKTTVILFLNKHDLFLRKFLEDKVPLNVSGKFPDAPTANETKEDAQLAVNWIANKFKALKLVDPAEHVNALLKPQIFIYVTTATDPSNVKTVFNVCKDVVLKESLNAFGFS